MNYIYKVIFNKATGTFSAVAEYAKGQGKEQGKSTVSTTAKKNHKKSPYQLALTSLLVAMGLTSGHIAQASGTIICEGQVVADNGGFGACLNQALGNNTTAMGSYNTVSGNNTTAMGAYNTVSGNNTTAMGSYNTASGNNATVMGSYNTVSGNNTTAMGAYTTASGNNTTAMGAYTTASGNNATAIGVLSGAYGDGSLATGGSSDNDAGGIAYSHGSMALGTKTVAGTDKGNEKAFAIGYNAKATKDKSMSLGFDSEVMVEGGIAIGSDAKATTDKEQFGYNASTDAISTNTDATWLSTHAALAIGDATTATRQITGLAAGTQDTDAVNVAQLKSVASLANTPIVFYSGGTTANEPSDYLQGSPVASVAPNNLALDFGDGLKAIKESGENGKDVIFVSLDKDALKDDPDFKGPKGDKGDQGPQGKQGLKGKDGTSSHFISINSKDTSQNNYMNEGATGSNAIAIGTNAKATAKNSVAIGSNAVASEKKLYQLVVLVTNVVSLMWHKVQI
ncbi:MAG: hypothetical protein CSA42_03120 [Gammaproteobacteria bacterium]|nr:MAG: hypothetical protein CSA42_03120 [Gammaproteobacteria bacterium]